MNRPNVALALVVVLAPCPLAAQAPPPRVAVAGYVQPRFEAIGDSALFKLRRARFGAQGALASWVSYKAQLELRTGGGGVATATAAATDLYVALERGDWSIVIGQAKTPFTLELNLGSSVLELPERATVVDSLGTSRDVGVQFEWRPRGPLVLSGGVFNGEGVNRAANADARFLYEVRAVLTAAQGVDVGASVAARPDVTGWGVEAALHLDRWWARGEYLREERPADAASGWYAQAWYDVRPRITQVVARVQDYDPSDAAGADRVTGWTLGLHRLIRGDDLKVQLEYTVFDEQGAEVDDNRVIVQLQARF